MLGGFAQTLHGLLGGRNGSQGVAATGLVPADTGSPVGGAAHRRTTGVTPAYRRGQPIARPLPPTAAASRFVSWMSDMGFVGEYAWRDLLDFYAWHCAEEKLLPIPVNHLASLAHELGELCAKGQIRVMEEGRRRRLTTYTILPPELVQLRRVA